MAKIKKIIISTLVILALTMPILSQVYRFNFNSAQSSEEQFQTMSKKTEKGRFVPIDEDLVTNQPVVKKSKPERLYRAMGTTWTKPPGNWWDTDWEYRVNITITEPNIADRNDWPINVFLEFSPVAYKYSIRVIDSSGNEIPSQIWNITYANTTHIKSCSITFLIDINQNGKKEYSIYWSTDETDPPTYPKSITFYEQDGTYYIYSSKGWHITLPSSYGGRISTFNFNNSDLEHQSLTINNDITHFGTTVSPTLAYEDYWGEYNTNNNEYVFRGIKELNDPLEQIYAGVVFITYVVERVHVEDNTGIIIGNATYYYQIFNWGINVYEEIDFGSAISNGLVYIGGWVFDQDNGDGGSRFSVVYPPENILPPETWESVLYDEFTSIDTSTWYTRSNSADYPQSDGDNLVLTPNSNGEYGQAWLNWEVGSDFIAEFSFWIGGGSGADGLVFMFYKSKDYSPYTGGSLGFTGSGTYNGFGIEVDTYGNNFDPYAGGTSDTAGHIAIIKDDVSNHLASYQVLRSVLREQWHTIKVEVIGDNVKVWFDGNLIINYTDIALLDRTYKWMGFSAATGGLNDYHKIGYFKLWVLTPGCEGEDIYIEKNYSNGEYVGIFNNNTRVGMGVIYYNLTFSGTAQAVSRIVIYNEGNQTNDGMQDSEDYIYFAVNLSKLNVSSGDAISLSYIVFPWNATNSIASSETKFDTIVNMIKNPLETEVNQTEKFKIRVKVRVIDAAGSIIPNVNVTLTNNTLKYTGFTDENGEIVFEVYRVKYRFIARLWNNINVTYENTSLEIAYNDTSRWHYYNLTDNVVIQFKDIYRIVIMTYAKDNETILQNGLIRLNDSSNIYVGYTNLTGDLEFYIKSGTWSIMFNHTSTNEIWDYFNLTLIGDGQIANNVKKYNLQVDRNMVLRLIDLNATEPPEITWLELYETSSTYEKYWNETVSIKVKFYRTLNKDLIDGKITWFVVDESNTLFINGSVNTINGVAAFTVNTSYLLPDKNYIIIINTSEIYTPPPTEGFALPSHISVFLEVNARPIDMSVTVTPSLTIYYSEEAYFTVTLRDYFTRDYISQANTTLKISGIPGYIELTEISSGTYQAYLPTLESGIYTITVIAKKENYTMIREEYVLRVMERPTYLSGPLSIEIPWNATYSFSIDYIDTRLNSHIESAYAIYKILDSRTGETIIPGTPVIEKSDHYVVKLNIYGNDLQEGNYLIQLIVGKKNYVNQTITIPFTIRLRQTSLEKETSVIKVYYGEVFSLKVYFYDLDNSSAPITDALSSYIIYDFETGNNVSQGDLTSMGNGTYYLEFNTSCLRVKHYYITITMYKEHFMSANTLINLIIEPIPTAAYVSKSSDTIEWGLYSVLYVNYSDGRTKTYINADKAVFEIINSTWSSGEISLILIQRGVYKLNISTIDYNLSPGIYKITIRLEKLYHENQTIVITLTVSEVKTIIFTQPSNITLYWGENGKSLVYWNRTRDGVFISADIIDLNVTDLMTSQTVTVGVTISLVDGVYVVNIDSSRLIDGHTYAIVVSLGKIYHENASAIIYVHVLSIPTRVVATPVVANITWGDDFNFSINIINLLNGSGVDIKGIENQMIILVGGNPIDVGEAITIMSLGDGKYVIMVKSGMLVSNQYYVIKLTLMKIHYDLPTIELTAGIQPVSVDVSIKTNSFVLKNPATGAATSTIEITLRESVTGAPISDAEVYVIVKLGTEVIFNITAQEIEPGVYVATIDWSGVEPGDYSISVEVRSITRHGYSAPTSIAASVSPAVAGVRVDYLGGSTVVAGRRYPNLVIYPIIIAIFLITGFIGYKYYSWFKLPIEVREVIQLLKKIQRDIYEYTALPREEQFKTVIKNQLGLE